LTNNDPTDGIQFKNGEVSSNKVFNGAVFLISEAPDMNFINSDTKPDSTIPTNIKILYDTVKF